MDYLLTLKFPTREQAQLWIEETFDLSAVQVLGIWQSPFRDQHIAKVRVTIDPEIKGAFNDGLDRIKGIWPEEKRILVYWEAVKQ